MNLKNRSMPTNIEKSKPDNIGTFMDKKSVPICVPEVHLKPLQNDCILLLPFLKGTITVRKVTPDVFWGVSGHQSGALLCTC